MEGFVGIYALLLIPGFIWVQVYEHYLLREKKEQFVKTLEIVLWSALIWAFALYLSVAFHPTNWFTKAITTVMPSFSGGKLIVESIVETAKGNNGFSKMAVSLEDVANFYVGVCLWSFLGANLWSLLRRTNIGNLIVMRLTGRDWYPTASHRFYAENVGKVVSVITAEREYFGILYSAPATDDDSNLMLAKVKFIPRPNRGGVKAEELRAVSFLLINVKDVSEIRALNVPVTRDRFWTKLKRDWKGKSNWLKSRGQTHPTHPE